MIQKKKISREQLLCLVGAVAALAIVMVLENTIGPGGQLFIVLKKGAVYALAAVSLNLLNGFTGLFSLGHAGFMLLGAYTYAILTVPVSAKDSVYYLFGGSAVKFSLPDIFYGIFGSEGAGGMAALTLGVLLAIILGGLVAAFFAWLIGLPVLRLKSDYLAIATLGFAEIIRAIFQWQALGPVTNGANMITQIPTFSSFNIRLGSGKTLYLSTFFPFLILILCLVVIVMLINSSYGRAFKAIREDEVAAEAMGINLARHKQLSFCISSFFAGIAGALFAMYASNAQAMAYTSTMTYEILLIVVIGGIGSVSGSVLATFLYVACSEWWLRGLDMGEFLGIRSGLFRSGFRMVVFSVVIMIVVLFFRRGIMGDKELTNLLFRRRKKQKAKEAAK
jgi:branched-chain amino acid transport system permease protein